MSEPIILIRINQHDIVWENFKEKYRVSPGDILEVIDEMDCKRRKGKCWEVRHVVTGEVGFVEVKRMKIIHSIGKKEQKRITSYY